MRVFLSAVEASGEAQTAIPRIIERERANKGFSFSGRTRAAKTVGVEKHPRGGRPLLWNLMSYYYVRGNEAHAELVRDNSEMILIDSGAHSFQKGKKVKWDEYTRDYAAFIKRFDRPNVVGYFEMDVDNIIGYENVLKLREILKAESGHADKIIPVWHKNRGVADFVAMCEAHAGLTVAITGFKNEDIRDEQYPMFVKEAKKHGCKVHCLGMTRREILDKVPFDYVDSSSWAQGAIYGKVGNRKVAKSFSKTNREDVFEAAYLEAMKMQRHYYRKWKKVCGD